MKQTKKPSLLVPGILALLLAAVSLLLFSRVNSFQAVDATAAQVRFAGEYRIRDGQWQQITPGKHIPATKGDVLLRGNFHLYTPDGDYIGLYREKMPLAFFTDHISLTFSEPGREPYVIDHENPLLGISACGVDWTAHAFSGDGTEPVEILVHNPHRFGNETAIDSMLENLAIWDNISFERNILANGHLQRQLGLIVVIVSLALLGCALFSTLLHLQNHRIMCLLGVTIFSAGTYLAYSEEGVSVWSEFTAVNTTIVGISMMLYMLFLSVITTYELERTKKVGRITTAALGMTDGFCFLMPMLMEVRFYDTWQPWLIIQFLGSLVLLVCLVLECRSSGKKKRWLLWGMAFMMIAFEADAIANMLGWTEGGYFSVYVFLYLFAAALFTVLRIIPEGFHAAEKAKELEIQHSRLEAEKNIIEAELKESRIAIMLSQIQPHFIYNTLGTIERMCLKDPEKAFELVRNFSLYLRGNFSELDSVSPISFTEELKHIEYYVNIERVRFPDMNIVYRVESKDFLLPALSVQPLVENAIKHGLMRPESGGTVEIRSYETPTHFCVTVTDDGVGFDVSQPMDEKKHVGIRNIRGRLKGMVNGELILHSRVGAGTEAMIRIPKEVDE